MPLLQERPDHYTMSDQARHSVALKLKHGTDDGGRQHLTCETRSMAATQFCARDRDDLSRFQGKVQPDNAISR